jgi:hypothetical protein
VTIPIPIDTTDLRAGAPLHDRLLALLPLVGEWVGEGIGVVASSGEEFRFGQRLSFAHDGRPFLAYESRSWLLDSDGAVIRPAMRESGFWRPGSGENDLEVQLVNSAGLSEMLTGLAGDVRWELTTDVVVPTPTARQVAGERRLYGLRGESLAYATELALPGADFGPHLNAALRRS